jgi:hypothetical protein
MNHIVISETQRIIVSRSGDNNACQWQEKETAGWETLFRKQLQVNQKHDVKGVMQEEYRQYKQRQEYDQSKLQPYH